MAARRCPGYPVDGKPKGGKAERSQAQAVHPHEPTSSPVQQSQYQPVALKEESHWGDPSEASPPILTTRFYTSPATPVPDQAECHFLSNFVLVAPEGTNRGFYEFIVPLTQAATPTSVAISYALKACALELFNNQQVSNNRLQHDAVGFHTKAISLTISALEDPTAASDDATIGSILLLLLFEIISSKQSESLLWRSHLAGAMKLIESRDRSQLMSKIGFSIFTAVRVQLILFALTSEDPVQFGNEWWMTDTFTDKFAALCLWLTLRTTHVRSELTELLKSCIITPDNIQRVKETMAKCHDLDQGFLQWSQNLPEHYQHVVVTWVTKDDDENGAGVKAFPGRVDVFRDPWLACIWNMMRCSRLELAGLIARCAAFIHYPADYRTTTEYSAVCKSSTHVITDLIASIPYQLGWFSERRELLPHMASWASGDDGVPKGLSGFIAVWPLMYIQQQDIASEMQRDWAKSQLDYIGARLGVRYAHAAIKANKRVPSMTIARDVVCLEANARFHAAVRSSSVI